MDLPYQLSNCEDTNDLYKIVTEIRIIDTAIINKLRRDHIQAHFNIAILERDNLEDTEAYVRACRTAIEKGEFLERYRNSFENQSFYGINLNHNYIREKAAHLIPDTPYTYPFPPSPELVKNVKFEHDYDTPSPLPSEDEQDCVRSVVLLDSSPEHCDRIVKWTEDTDNHQKHSSPSRNHSEKPKLKSIVKKVKPQATVKPRLKSLVKKLY